jgi:NitT/TauT family transport system permease protein
VVRGLVGGAGVMALAEALAALGIIPVWLAPPMVGRALVELLDPSSGFWIHAVSTLLSWLIALGLVVAIGVPLGLLLGSVPSIRDLVTIPMEMVAAIPATAIAPLAALAMGGGGAQVKILLAVLVAVRPTLLHTERGVQSIGQLHRDTAAAFGIRGWRAVVFVSLPSIAPVVLTGVRLSVSVALVVIVSTEFLVGGGIGVGQYAATAGAIASRNELIIAAALVPAFAAYGMNSALLAVQRRWMRWAPPGGAA